MRQHPSPEGRPSSLRRPSGAAPPTASSLCAGVAGVFGPRQVVLQCVAVLISRLKQVATAENVNRQFQSEPNLTKANS